MPADRANVFVVARTQRVAIRLSPLLVVAAVAAASGLGGSGAGVLIARAADGHAGGLERVRKAGELRWGADIQGGEPFAFEDPGGGGRLVGFEVEIAAALARELGVRATFVQNDWSTLVPSLERGSYDVALNGLEVTPALAARILFSRPYYVFAERLMARAGDARVRDLASLRGLRVGTLASSSSWGLLQTSGATPVPYEGVEEPFIDLEHGRLDAVLMDDVICQFYGQRHASLRVVGDVADGVYALGLRRGDEDLLDALDAALARMAASGELRAILARWKIDSPRQARLASFGSGVPPAAGAGSVTGAGPATGAGSVAGAGPAMGAGSAAGAGSLAGAGPAGVAVAPPSAPFDAGQLLLFLRGALVTLLVSCGAMALAVPLGLLLAVARSYGRGPLRAAAAIYVEVLRGTPVLLQLFVIYYGLAGVVSLDAWAAAVLGLGLNYAAYEAEVYRGGLQAVPRGQLEAAWSLGMPTPLALRRVVLPQAFRFALPGVANDFIALLKDSSLVSVISVVELTKRMSIFAVERREWLLPGVLCAALYLGMSYPLSRLARRLEARLAAS